MNTQLLNTAAIPGHNTAKPKLSDAQKEAISKAMDALATKLADTVTPEMDAAIALIDKSKKDLANGPFMILKLVKETVPADKLALFPTPGTDETTSECPDKYEEVYYRDGKKKFRQTSFYLKFFLQHYPEGKRIAAALEHIRIANDEKANHSVVPADIMAMNPVDREAMREDLVSSQNTGVKALRDAIALEKQFDLVNSMGCVQAMPLMDKEGNVRKIAKPIKVWNTEEPENEWNVYSVSGFMQFDPAKALDLDAKGTFAALKLTAKREQGEDDNPDGADAPKVINTNAVFVARLADIHEYIANKLMADPKRELLAMFTKEHVNGAGSDDLIESLDDIKAFCTRILNIPAVQTRLEIIANKPAKDAA